MRKCAAATTVRPLTLCASVYRNEWPLPLYSTLAAQRTAVLLPTLSCPDAAVRHDAAMAASRPRAVQAQSAVSFATHLLRIYEFHYAAVHCPAVFNVFQSDVISKERERVSILWPETLLPCNHPTEHGQSTNEGVAIAWSWQQQSTRRIGPWQALDQEKLVNSGVGHAAIRGRGA